MEMRLIDVYSVTCVVCNDEQSYDPVLTFVCGSVSATNNEWTLSLNSVFH